MNDELSSAGKKSNSPFTTHNLPLFKDLQQIVEQGKQQVDQAVNMGLTATYWNIGKRINEDVLQNSRAEYGKQILPTLLAKLTNEYGRGWSVKQLQHCLHFVETFPDIEIVSTLWRQLSWSHFKTIIYLKTDLEREFYAQTDCYRNRDI